MTPEEHEIKALEKKLKRFDAIEERAKQTQKVLNAQSNKLKKYDKIVKEIHAAVEAKASDKLLEKLHLLYDIHNSIPQQINFDIIEDNLKRLE